MAAREIIRAAGFKICKGIGSEWEFFVSDGKNAITCYELPNGSFEAYSSNEETNGFKTSDEKEILALVKAAFEEEQNFIANGGESLQAYQLQNGEWR